MLDLKVRVAVLEKLIDKLDDRVTKLLEEIKISNITLMQAIQNGNQNQGSWDDEVPEVDGKEPDDIDMMKNNQ